MNNVKTTEIFQKLKKRLFALLIVQLIATVLTICTVICTIGINYLVFVPGSNMILAITFGGAVISRSIFAVVAVVTLTMLMFLSIFEVRRGGWRTVVPAALIAFADVIFGFTAAFLIQKLFYYSIVTSVLLALCSVFSVFLLVTEIQYIVHAKKGAGLEIEFSVFKKTKALTEEQSEQDAPAAAPKANKLLYYVLLAESVLTAVAVVPALFNIDIFIANLTTVRCVEFLKEALRTTLYLNAFPVSISLTAVIVAFYLAVMPLSAMSVKRGSKVLPLLSLVFHFAELCAILISFSFYLSIYGTVWFGLLVHTVIDVFVIVLIMKYL